MLVDAGAGRPRGCRQGERELAVVDLMILRGKHRAGQLAGKVGLAPSGFGGGNPVQRQGELLLGREVMNSPALASAVGALTRRPPRRKFPAHPEGSVSAPANAPHTA